MIPKIVHYCWFGRGEKPELAVKCIESWKRYLPEYEIIEWNEDNFDIQVNDYVREAYENRKFAFVTDVVRLYAMYTCGGIYMDTDVEVLKPLDMLLNYEAVSGFESETRIPTGLMGSIKGSPIIKELLEEYNNIHFQRSDGSLDLTTNVTRITSTLLRHGLILNNRFQTIGGFTLLPADFLCPKSYEDGKIYLTENTLCIHHFSGSWKDDETVYAATLQKSLWFVPTIIRGYLAAFIAKVKHHSLKEAMMYSFNWAKRK